MSAISSVQRASRGAGWNFLWRMLCKYAAGAREGVVILWNRIKHLRVFLKLRAKVVECWCHLKFEQWEEEEEVV
jgi:hypothetical protein